MECIINDESEASNVAWSAAKCKSKIEEIGKTCLTRNETFKPNHFALTDSDGNLTDSDYILNDSLPPSETVIWSSNKIITTIEDYYKNILKNSLEFQPNTFLMYDKNGILQSSEYRLDDESFASDKVLFSADKWQKLLDSVSQTTIPRLESNDSFSGYLCQINSDGIIDISKKYRISDNDNPEINVLWTSSKTVNEIQQHKEKLELLEEKLNSHTNRIKNIQEECDKKIEFVDGIPGNLLHYDSEGRVADSGIKIDDYADADELVIWSSSKINQLVNEVEQKCQTSLKIPNQFISKNIPIFDSNGNIIDSGFKIDDNDNSLTSLWTSEKQNSHWKSLESVINSKIQTLQDTKMEKFVKPLVENCLVKSDADGNLIASSVVIDDKADPDNTVIWTSEKIDSTFAKFEDLPIISKNLILCNERGNLQDSGIKVDDTCTSNKCIWTAEKTINYCKTFFINGLFNEKQSFESQTWYIPSFFVADSSEKEYVSEKILALPINYVYHINVFGIVYSSLPCEVEMKCNDKTTTKNYITNTGFNHLNFVYIMNQSDIQNLTFHIKINSSENVQMQLTNLRFFIKRL